MAKSNIIKASILAIIVPLCLIGAFIILKTKTGLSIPIYLVIIINLFIQRLIYQYYRVDEERQKR